MNPPKLDANFKLLSKKISKENQKRALCVSTACNRCLK